MYKRQVLTLPGSTTYFEDGDGKNGFEYVIAKAFADSLGVGLRVTTKSTLSSLLLSVGGPQGDFAAANLVSTADRGKSLSFSSPYHQVVQQLIYRAGEKKLNRSIAYKEIYQLLPTRPTVKIYNKLVSSFPN